MTASAQTATPAQTPAPAPTTRPQGEPPQTMMLTWSFSGGAANESDTLATDALRGSGFHTDSDALMTYQRRAGRARFGVTARSVFRYAPSSATPTTMYDEGGVDFSVTGSRSRLHASQNVSYSPYYQLGALPDAVLSPLSETAQSHGDFANTDLKTFRSVTGVDWSQTINRLYTLSVSYNVRRTTFSREDLDLSSQDISVRVVRRLSRYVSLRTGYGQQFANSTFAQTTSARNHDLDLGLDYSRALSVSRRTTVSFSSGSSVTPQNRGTAFNLTGNAALARQIGRTWSARVAFNRSVQVLEGFTQPVLSNAVTTTVTGALGRRASVSSSAGFTTGTVGLGPTSGNTYSNGNYPVGKPN